ncbi:MAG: GDP-mannose 4,6-dehydratase [Lachnospiraceae bacterium]|nr:GDP-mannose 4,6-dehydratase [Lachnospiraceae bacterium]
MKKALVIGAAGFVGSYLIRHLHNDLGYQVSATKLPQEVLSEIPADVYDLNILDKDAITELLFRLRPDYIFHLAAQSSVSVAWKNPCLTVDVNIKGAINLMDAIRELFYKPRVVIIGSGEEYGHIRSGETPIKEENRLDPGNIYAATKACQNMIGSIYSKAYDMELIMVRAFNHIGPGQSSIFVVSDFCRQVAEIEKGLREPKMYVGNLSAQRDFTDVRDVVRAYALLAAKGQQGETYNVGSGKAREIRQILQMIIEQSSAAIEVEVDPAKIRPVDVPIIEADITKLHQETQWLPEIPLEQTIKEVLNYWRDYIEKEAKG